MISDWPEKRAKELANDICQDSEKERQVYVAAYCAAYDDMKDEIQEYLSQLLCTATRGKYSKPVSLSAMKRMIEDEYEELENDLKAKLREVPWTISDESMALHEFQERERPSIGERVAFLNGIHWAEKRIREREL
ncbi:MAG: hypothetical protein BWZ03_00068 [bacterium ADurb.BinA186]|nr:MAG: hypothetical protein BWZ03_00068 [bacterium ADurb.BinA186]